MAAPPVPGIMLFLMVAASALAGCVGSGGEGEDAISTTNSPPRIPSSSVNATQEEEADAAHGTLAGTVTDDEGQPVGAAVVSLEGLAVQAGTDQAGTFSIGRLAAGTYVMYVAHPGFEAYARSVKILGQETTTVAVTLVAVPIQEEGYTAAHPITAYIDFGQNVYDVTVGWSLVPLCSGCEFWLHIQPNPVDMRGEASWVKSVNLPPVSEHIYYNLRGSTDNASATSLQDGVLIVSGYWAFGPMPRDMEDGDPEEGIENMAGFDVVKVAFGGGFTDVAIQQRVESWFTFGYAAPIPMDYSAFPVEP